MATKAQIDTVEGIMSSPVVSVEMDDTLHVVKEIFDSVCSTICWLCLQILSWAFCQIEITLRRLALTLEPFQKVEVILKHSIDVPTR